MARHNRSVIGTLVERNARFVLLLPVDAANRSESLRDGFNTAMLRLPLPLRRILTWDQGWK